MRGRFITFEGGEGAGKSTHTKLLAEHLGAFGIDVVLTREPGGSPGAEIIRHVILSGAAKPLGAEAETMLFASARDDHLRETIERITVGDTVPDLTFVLDVPAEVGMERAGKRRGEGDADRFESETLEFHQKLRAGFLALAKSAPERCVLIDVTAPRQEVATQIWNVVEQRLRPASAVPRIGGAQP
jgi:dTMP kinase